MRRACLVLVLMFAVEATAAQKPCPQPVWTVDLAAKYGFRPFERFKGGWGHAGWPEGWKTQRGMAFISSEVLAVYQIVVSTELAPRGHRDESGGGGKYILQVVFFETKRGAEIRTLRLITSGSDLSAVYPTREGKFLVRTGLTLRLFSSDFEEVTSRTLPQLPPGHVWGVRVSPSGSHLLASTVVPSADTVWGVKHIELVLDANTLAETTHQAGPSEVLGAGSSGSGRTKLDRPPPTTERVTEQLIAQYDNKQLQLFLLDGRLFWDVPMRNEVWSVVGQGLLLAAEIHRHRPDPFDLGIQSKPLRIALYDLATKSEVCSIRTPEAVSSMEFGGRSRFYDLSPAGTLAVIQGTTLSFYRP